MGLKTSKMANTTLHQAEDTNTGTIAAGASDFFFSTEDNRKQFQLHGQTFNAFELMNDSAQVFDIDFDARATDTAARRRRIFGKSTLVIEPKDNFFFSTVKVTNRDGANTTAANELKAIARIVKEV